MAPSPPQLADLAKRLRDKQVLVVAGAGVSRQTTDNAPSWTDLIRAGLSFASQRVNPLDAPRDWDKLITGETQIVEDTLPDVAEDVCRALDAPRGGLWADWLRESLGSLPVERPELIEALHALGLPIATCNFDTLIEDVTKREPVTWQDPGEIQRILYIDRHDAASKVIHLHGRWNDPGSVILGTRSYDLIGSDPSFQSLLRALMWSHLFVFVGFGAGMEDPNFGALRSWMLTHLQPSSEQHLHVVRDGADAEAARRVHRGSVRIFPLVYGREYGELTDFFKALARDNDTLQVARSTKDEQDTERSRDIHLLRPAAAHGNSDASFILGLKLRQAGQTEEAEIHLLRAARVGNAAAAYTLGLLLREQNRPREAEPWLLEAATVGDIAAAHTLGRLLEDSGRFDAAFNWEERAAHGRDVAAAFTFGRMLNDLGRPQDAVAWLKYADAHGEPLAAAPLAQILEAHPEFTHNPPAFS